MENGQTEYATIDEYIRQFPEDIQEKLTALRETIRQNAPDATEKISYRMPTFYLGGNLVHFAAFKRHIGFFPTAEGVEAFAEEIKEYKTSKGTMQFPLDKPLPLGLVAKIVQHRVKENTSKKAKK